MSYINKCKSLQELEKYRQELNLKIDLNETMSNKEKVREYTQLLRRVEGRIRALKRGYDD